MSIFNLVNKKTDTKSRKDLGEMEELISEEEIPQRLEQYERKEETQKLTDLLNDSNEA